MMPELGNLTVRQSGRNDQDDAGWLWIKEGSK
jgi:hypothetical protein